MWGVKPFDTKSPDMTDLEVEKITNSILFPAKCVWDQDILSYITPQPEYLKIRHKFKFLPDITIGNTAFF